MGKTQYWASELVGLFFNSVGIPNLADNASVSPYTQWWLSLHTADPTAGDQTTNEIGYTGYSRVAVARNLVGWTGPSAGTVFLNAPVLFPLSTGGSGVAAFVGIGSASTGMGILFYAGPLAPNISCTAGIQPRLTTGSSVTES